MLYSIFSAVLNMSITASVVILCVMLARLVLKRAPKIFSYALWAVVLFRLLCPVSLNSDFSLLSVFETPMTEAGRIEYVPLNVTNEENPAVTVSDNSTGTNDAPAQAEERPEANSPALFMPIAAGVWLSGIAVMLVYNIVQLIRLRRRLIGAAPLQNQKGVYLADHIETPFVMGILFPKIYLPSSLSEEEYEYIIRHERHHVRRGDHIVKLIGFIALCIHWFNPLAWIAFALSCKDMEMSCDEAVMRKTGRDIRADYSSSLLRFSTGRKISIGTPLAFGEGDTKERIVNIMKYKKPAVWISVVCVILCLLLTACLGVNPEKESAPSDETDKLSLTGYIREVDVSSRKIVFDQVSWLTPEENAEQLKEIGIDPSELSNGFYIYNPETENSTYSVSDGAFFRIFEIPENGSWTLTETSFETFAESLNTRTPMYQITLENGKIVEISERYIP